MVAKHAIPSELERKIPPFSLLVLDLVWLGRLFGIAFSTLTLYGPIANHVDHNGVRYLVGPWVGPIVVAACYRLFPFNPYRGMGARAAAMVDLDRLDSDAHRLVEIYRSKAAHAFLVGAMLKTSIVVFLIMALITVVTHQSMSWTLLSPWLVPGLLGSCIGSLGTVGLSYVAWGLQTWARSNRGDRIGP